MADCRKCPSCHYALEPRELHGHHHVLTCHNNVLVELAGGFPPILADRPAADGPLPDEVKPCILCPKESVQTEQDERSIR
jgi:hypothetical protein